MIRVERSSVAAPEILVEEGSKGRLERQAVIDFYKVKSNQGKPFKGYKVYGEKAVKDRLCELFHDKCAYCEIDYGGAPWDVEHFRPKSAIVEIDPKTLEPVPRVKAIKPGYYWLAAEWTNLLPSCIDCNRRREHAFSESGARTAGKGNYFPLRAVEARVRRFDRDVSLEEEPLLIDPCADDPRAHLLFGTKGIIVARTDRGEATIRVFGLQREPLVRQREIVRTLLLNSIAAVRSAAQRLKERANDTNARADFVREMNNIRENFLHPACRFLAMSQQIVRESLGPAI